MIWLDDNGKVCIRTEIDIHNIDELVAMKKSVLNLLATQDENFTNRNENWYAFQLIELLEPSPEHLCLKK